MMVTYSLSVGLFICVFTSSAVAQVATSADGVNIGPMDAIGRGEMKSAYEVKYDAVRTPAGVVATELVTGLPEPEKEERRFPFMLEGDGKVHVGAVETTKPAGTFTATRIADATSDAQPDEAPKIGRSVGEAMAEAAARWGASWPDIIEWVHEADGAE